MLDVEAVTAVGIARDKKVAKEVAYKWHTIPLLVNKDTFFLCMCVHVQTNTK